MAELNRRLTLAAGLTTLLCACALIVDYQVPLKLHVQVTGSDGSPAVGTQVVLADGLAERALGVTDSKGQLVATHMFLWGHRKGAKPTPPEFRLVFRRPECGSAARVQVVTSARGADGFYPVEVQETLQCN